MKEVWRDIAGYEGLYQVSNLGRVRSLDRDIEWHDGSTHHIKGRILKQCLDKAGYHVVGFNKKHILKTHRVHRLVAMAFLPNPDNLPQVDHISGCKEDNSKDNLRWVSARENVLNPNTFGQHIENVKKGSEACKKKVFQLLNGRIVGKFCSIADAGRVVGRKGHNGSSSISSALRGKTKSAYGYQWKYA